MKIQESAENYLETILELSHEKSFVRSIDVATRLGFSKPSVSIAMKNFVKLELVEINENGHIFLLPKGREIAEKTFERHHTLKKLLVSIGVDEQTAQKDACKIEHVISQQTFDCLKNVILPKDND